MISCWGNARLSSVMRHLPQVVAMVVMAGLTSLSVHAAGEVTELGLKKVLAKPAEYEAGEDVYRWGEGIDLGLDSFSFAGERYVQRDVAQRVMVRRVDNLLTQGETCSLFAEVDRTPLSYQATFPGRIAGECDFDLLFREPIINRGAVDLFSNQDDGDLVTAGNIERLDFLFPEGIMLPPGSGSTGKAGFLITEKGGNSNVKIAAITAIDAVGNPSSYGKLVELLPSEAPDDTAVRFGMTDVSLNSDFLANAHRPPNGSVVSTGTSFIESIGAAFVSLQHLGLESGDVLFGFSLFGADVDDQHDLLDPTTFPRDTRRINTPGADGAFGGDADLYGGIASYFTAVSLHTIAGRIFRDVDGSGQQDPGEDGVANVTMKLFADNGDGRFDSADDQLVGERTTSPTGQYRLTGLPAGGYWVTPDLQDTDFPSGYQVAGAALPRLVLLSADDAEAVDFVLYQQSGSQAALLARPDEFVMFTGQPLLLDILRNDRIPAGQQPALVIAVAPLKGNLQQIGNKLLYTAFVGQGGHDGFSYTLKGQVGETSTTSVVIDIQPSAAGDHDGDGVNDQSDPDDDNDSIPDYIEGGGDMDGDGIPNQLDEDADGDGILDLIESSLTKAERLRLDQNQDGRLDHQNAIALPGRYTLADTDQDGRPDALDLDADNDGIPDVIEAGFVDSDHDGKEDSGAPGYRLPRDTDGNGVFDFRQLDSDSDGVFDITEAGLSDSDGDGRVDQFADEDFNGIIDGQATAVLGDEGTRLPDSNNNGIPDFQEVDASRLRTGVSGWGGGMTAPLLLPGLVVLAILTRRRGAGRPGQLQGRGIST